MILRHAGIVVTAVHFLPATVIHIVCNMVGALLGIVHIA